MNRQLLLIGTALGGFIFSSCEKKEESPQTNFIIILADDLGYGDLSCFGGKEVETPHLDDLAGDGIRMTQFYAASAVCTPSRASVLTGNYPLRYNIRQYFPRNGFLPDDTPSIPELLKSAGYYSAHVGKWHLGGISPEHLRQRNRGIQTEPGPLEHGFDHYFCNVEGDPDMPDLLGTRRLYRDGGKYLIEDDHPLPEDTAFLTNIFTDEAIRIIDSMHNADQAFFLNLWYRLPHTPYEPAPEPHYSKYEKLNYPERPDQNFHRGHNAPGDKVLYNSMVSHLDSEIGRLVDRLKQLGLYENTLIIFTSDNGPSYRGYPSPWTGGKADLHEGGIRVPMIACWPAGIPKGSVSGAFGHTNDILPTFCEVAGLDPDTISVDGVSILDELQMKDSSFDRGMVYWQLDQAIDPWGNVWYPQPGKKPEPYATAVVRSGKWKMLTDSITPVAMYNLDKDPYEQVNLLGKHPEPEEEMTQGLREFFAAPRLDCGRKPTDPRSL